MRAHRIRYFNNFSRKPLKPLQILYLGGSCWGKRYGGDVRAPLRELTCNQCSNGMKDDKSLHTNPHLHVATLPKFLLQCQVQFWAKGANSIACALRLILPPGVGDPNH